MLSRTIKQYHIFRNRLLGGLAWNLIGAIALQGSALVTSALLVHLLGLKEFGAYQLIITTLFMVGNVAQGGCAFVATKIIAENLKANPDTVGTFMRFFGRATLAAGCVATLAVFVLIPFICDTVLERPELQTEMRLALLSILFQVVFTYRTGALQGFAAFRELGQVSCYAGIASIFLIAAGAEVKGLEGALMAYSIATGVRALAAGFGLRIVSNRHGIKRDLAINRSDWHHLLHLALPAGLAGMVTVPALWIVNLSVSKLPDGLTLVGIFALAHQIRQAALYLPTLLNSVTFSIMSSAKGSGDLKGARNLFWAGFSANIVVGFLFAAIMFAGAGLLLRALNVTSNDGAIVLRVLAISIFPELIAMTAYQLIQSSGNMWRSLLQIAIPRDSVNCGLALYFVPQFGIAAAASSYLIGQIVGLIATLLVVHQTRNKGYSNA